MKEKKILYLWDFINVNSWSALFTLLLVINGIRTLFTDGCPLRITIGIIVILACLTAVISFSKGMLKFVHNNAIIYWIILGALNSLWGVAWYAR